MEAAETGLVPVREAAAKCGQPGISSQHVGVISPAQTPTGPHQSFQLKISR